MSHLDSHKMLNDAQHGFRKCHSCESQLILIVQDLAKGLNDGEQIDAVLLDFSKAFDKAPPPTHTQTTAGEATPLWCER